MDQKLTLVPRFNPKIKLLVKREKLPKGTGQFAKNQHRTWILEWSFFNIKGKWQKRHDSDISSESDVDDDDATLAFEDPPDPAEIPEPVA